MDGLCIFLVILLGVASCSQDQTSQSVLEVTVTPGDNITLYCDCKSSTGVYIVWYRNCSHKHQPTLALNTVPKPVKGITDIINHRTSNFKFLSNSSSASYDLLIMNITDSDEGLYYCGTEETKVDKGEYITQRNIYSYGNVTTRIICNSSETQPNQTSTHQTSQPNHDWCWMLLLTLCPAFALLSSLLSSLMVYQLCQKKAKEVRADQERPDDQEQTGLNQDQDVCYAALEIRQASQRPKKQKTKSSDYSTYSAINTSRM
ncbi:uncharacterized protein LOC121180129 isoform X1 [Toxotes jaculatrix]|uniref:uncharacterized protein LOC121180129 isoform X1 n=1 Tax=Toxotes jaculatrix TaxID=941984 RepID=UPI001B3B07A2|nr:uncharacterized protein LOC121180129 isoform X1 [Toxotes jaculatrix]